MVEVGLEEREEEEEEEEWRGRAATTRVRRGPFLFPCIVCSEEGRHQGGGLSGMKFDYPRRLKKLWI